MGYLQAYATDICHNAPLREDHYFRGLGPSVAAYRTRSHPFIRHVGLIQKKQTRGPNYIPQLAKVCRAPQATAIWSISKTGTTKA
jgi:hypothetical protein